MKDGTIVSISQLVLANADAARKKSETELFVKKFVSFFEIIRNVAIRCAWHFN